MLRQVPGVQVSTPEARWREYDRAFRRYEKQFEKYRKRVEGWELDERKFPWLMSDQPEPPLPPDEPNQSAYWVIVPVGDPPVRRRLGPSQWDLAQENPIKLGPLGCPGREHWFFKDCVYATTDLRLTPADTLALINEAENKRRLRLEKAHALQAMKENLDAGARRQPISQEVKIEVWQRDRGRCVECGSNLNLEFDHIIPLAMGGSNSARNLQLLCEDCNRRKGATLG